MWGELAKANTRDAMGVDVAAAQANAVAARKEAESLKLDMAATTVWGAPDSSTTFTDNLHR